MKWGEMDVPRRVGIAKRAGLEGRLGSRDWADLPDIARTAIKDYLASLSKPKPKAAAPEPQAYLMWVGAKHYPTYKDFVVEAKERGVSKRIGKAVNSIRPGETVIFLAHDDGLIGHGFVFGYFVVARIEIVLPKGTVMPTWVKVQCEAVLDVSKEDERGCGWRSPGGMYLVSETDVDTLKEVAKELGIKHADIKGGFVELQPRDYSNQHRFRGALQVGYRDILRLPEYVPDSDKAVKAPEGRHQWTKHEDELLVEAMESGVGSKATRMTRFSMDWGISKAQAIYRYNLLQTLKEQSE